MSRTMCFLWPLYYYPTMFLMVAAQFLNVRVRRGGAIGFLCVYPWFLIEGLAWVAYFSTKALGEGL